MQKYKDFEDFVNDPSFQEWAKGTNAESVAHWEKWRLDHPELGDTLDKARRFIQLTGEQKEALSKNEIEAEVQQLYENIDESERTKSATLPKIRRISPLLKWAAAVAFILTASILGYVWVENNAAVSILTEQTQKGEQREIILSDGTKVTLNVDTKFQYPEEFSKEKREVTLTGEAFFEVTKDADRPFIIKSGPVDVEVLGTSFNVSNYQEDENLAVELISGAVMVKFIQGEEQIVPLRPQEKFNYRRTSQKWAVDSIESKQLTGWMNGVLYFNNAPLDHMLREMERWFDVDIQVKNKTLLPASFTGTFEDPSLKSVLEGMDFILDLNYSINEKVVTIEFQ